MHRAAEGREVVRILRDVARKVEQGQTEGKPMDMNGNSVGEYGFTQGRTDGSRRRFTVTIQADNDAFKDYS